MPLAPGHRGEPGPSLGCESVIGIAGDEQFEGRCGTGQGRCFELLTDGDIAVARSGRIFVVRSGRREVARHGLGFDIGERKDN